MNDSITYEEFENAELKRAQREQKVFAITRQKKMEKDLQDQAADAQTARVARRAQLQRDQQAAVSSMSGQYAKTGLQHAVAQRQWRQRLSDLGLLDSGLRQTGQRAADGDKAAADAGLTAQTQKKQAALADGYDKWRDQQTAAQQAQEAKIRAAVQKEIEQHATRLYQDAKKRAAAQYKAVLQATAKEAKEK